MPAPPGCAPDPTHAAGDSVLCRRAPGPPPRPPAPRPPRHSPLGPPPPRPAPAARIWPRLAHTPRAPPARGTARPPRRHSPVSAPSAPAPPPSPHRPACTRARLRPRRWPGPACAPRRPPASVRRAPRRRPRHSRPVPGQPPAPAQRCAAAPGLKGLCPQGGIKSLKVGRWRPRPPLALISAKFGTRGLGSKNKKAPALKALGNHGSHSNHFSAHT